MRLVRLLPLALATVALSGCPEERPDAKRPLPRDRFPPAMSVPQPKREPIATPAATPAPARSNEATPLPAGTAAPQATPSPDGGVRPSPAR